MSRRRAVHRLVSAVRAAGGEVETVRGRVRVMLPPGVPPDDRPLLTLVLQHLVDRAASASTRRRQEGAQ